MPRVVYVHAFVQSFRKFYLGRTTLSAEKTSCKSGVNQPNRASLHWHGRGVSPTRETGWYGMKSFRW